MRNDHEPEQKTALPFAEHIVGTLAFVAIVAFFAISQVWGFRAFGTVIVLSGLWCVWKRKIPYGIEGREPAGHLTGWVAMLVGAIQIAAGVALIIAAHEIAANGGLHF